MKGNLKTVASLAISQFSKPPAKSSIATNWTRHWAACNYSTQSNAAIPEKCDVCIIGGGAMGSSTAFWLKRQPEGKNLKVVVIERDNQVCIYFDTADFQQKNLKGSF